MTFNVYNQQIAETLLVEFKLSSNQVLSSTSNFGDLVLIDVLSGSNQITLSNNIISLPQGYEFYVRFFVGVERSSTSSEIYTKIFYSDNSSINGVTLSEIGGIANNKVSLEDTTCIVNTSNSSKDIIIKSYKNSSSYTASLLSDYCYGMILGIKK